MYRFVVNFLEPVACLVYLLALLLNFIRNKGPFSLALSGYYLVASVLLTMGCLGVGHTDNNIWVYDSVALLTAVSIGAYFYNLLQARSKKITVLLLIAAYVAYAIVRNFTLQGPRLFDSLGYAMVSASVTVYVFMYFHHVLNNVTDTSIFREFNFWLSSGYLLYFLGSSIIFISYYYFTKKYLVTQSHSDAELLTALWGLHNVLLFVGALSLLTGSLWVTYRRKSR
ncbi:hypothetical protein [Flavisolibacter ginsenosidimutans]|uniref:Uncharacterized protein n=1 Tax=Flavisolibacter ginsenosidimutans TaxID=661481 RepID=A0A5B8UKH0_9BACT|nr:hypothetical protein [Flavisolibacter ginsenosidimutans]QEC57053.1 hypothetical protein FSB75_14460 [Flavisolibacter ginsenosidimutans]